MHRRALQEQSIEQLKLVETLGDKHRKAINLEDAWKKAPSIERDAEVARRVGIEINSLFIAGGEYQFQRRVSVMASLVVGWENLHFDGSSEFSRKRCEEFFNSCPWALEQVENLELSRADFLSDALTSVPAPRAGNSRSRKKQD